MAKLVFTGDAVTPAEILEKVKEAKSLMKLEFLHCACVSDDVVLKLCPYINQELLCMTAQDVKVTSKGFKVILERCPTLQHLRFISCRELDSDIIEYIGAHCTRLKSLAVEYVENQSRGWSADVLSLLVKNCSSELNSISFAGFQSVSDIGVNYVAECYFSSLQRVNFNQCSNITDKSLIGLANTCRFLREINVSSTSITDKGVLALAEKCLRLRQVDFSNCSKLTNCSISVLAEKCRRLEDVNLSNCSILNEESLISLAEHCPSLNAADFSGTAIKIVPPLVLGLKKLKTLNVNMCKELTHPPADIVTKKLRGILDFYKEYNVTYRLKVFFLGEANLGKTSLIQSIVEGAPQKADQSTEGVRAVYWQPLKSALNDNLLNRRIKPEEEQLLLELWDLTGRKVCQGVHQLFLTQDALYLILFNPHDHGSCDRLHSHVKAVQAKAPGSRIVLIGTDTDGSLSSEQRESRSQEVLRPVLQAERLAVDNITSSLNNLGKLEKDIKVEQRKEGLEFLLHLRPKIEKNVIFINYKSGEGLEELRSTIVTKCLSYKSYHHLGRAISPTSIRFLETIIQLREKGKVIVPWSEFIKLTPGQESDNEVETEIERLHLAGAIVDFKFIDILNTEEQPLRYLCLQPAVMAHLVCLLHVDDPRKSFKIEARRFWPRDSGCKKPDPSVLVKALEEIPTRGVVREVLLPILWQDSLLDQHQVSLMCDVLVRMGVLVAHDCAPLSGLALPLFPSLSSDTSFYLPLMDSLPRRNPQLNWTAKPFKGDIQISWRYTFPNGIPPGFLLSLVTVSRIDHSGAPPVSYKYVWNRGALFRIGEALICIQSADKKFIDICCRVNADERGAEKSAVEYLWAHLSIFVLTAEHFLASWPGLFDQVTLVPLGNPFYNGDVILHERDFPLMQCLEHAQQGENIKFVDDHKERELLTNLLIPHDVSQFKDVASWIRHIHSKRDVVFSLMQSDSDDSAVFTPSTFDQSALANQESPRRPAILSKSGSKKCLDVKWDLSDLQNEDNMIDKTRRTLNRRFCSTDKLPVMKLTESEHDTTGNQIDAFKSTKVCEDENQNVPMSNDDKTKNSPLLIENTSLSCGAPKPESKEFQKQEVTWTPDVIAAANQAAARFVASVLASSVAEFIRLQHEDNHRLDNRISSAQVRAAKITADAAIATHSGAMEAAAQAVLSSAEGVKDVLDRRNESYKSVRSKMCRIL